MKIIAVEKKKKKKKKIHSSHKLENKNQGQNRF